VKTPDFPRPRLLLSDCASGGVPCDDCAEGDDFLRRLAAVCDVLPVREGAVDGVLLRGCSPLTDPDAASAGAALDREPRLRSIPGRERFLTLLFALARLREVESSGERARLVDFHARYKYVLLAYDEFGMRELGALVAAVAERSWEDSLHRYRSRLIRAFEQAARPGGHGNALAHAFGHLSDRLAPEDRQRFGDAVAAFTAGRTPVGAVLALLRGWAIRLEVPYIRRQAYLCPFPRSLALSVEADAG
jgi:uncharacterized protein YbgA (DUF1722 family)